MNKKLIITTAILALNLLPFFSIAQKNNSISTPQKPKLIVGIVVDQMRYDLLWRFYDLYGEGGFRKLTSEGFLCKNTSFNYFITTTAPGHSSIYTGTTPSMHGIIDNNYFDRSLNQDVYVMDDKNVLTVGNGTPAEGKSPFRLMSSTVTDELKLVSRNSKVFGIAIKDRSAMMPAGHFADGAFYFDSKTGNWISSTWYVNDLPAWLKDFNQSRAINNYLNTDWNLLLPASRYAMCTNDSNAYEHPLPGEKNAVFPHRLTKESIGILPYTPFGNTMTKDIAIATIKNEGLGKGTATDFLCISFSSPDLIGHYFGPNSMEVADCYARFDRDLADLFKCIDDNVGRENCLIFLTADHGAAINPQFAKDHHLEGGLLIGDSLAEPINRYVSKYCGKGNWILAVSNQQVYLNRSFIATTDYAEARVAQYVTDYLLNRKEILCVSAPLFNINLCNPVIQNSIMNNYYPERSGEIFYSMKPGWIDWIYKEGTSHGTAFSYDNHVPLLFYGWKIPAGESMEKVMIPDIAPTLSGWLNIAYPSGCSGNPIPFIPLR